MPDDARVPKRKASKEKRVLNEFNTKIENEVRIDTVFTVREHGDKSLHDIMPFECECADKTCEEKILMSTEEYKKVHLKDNNFVVIPSHVQADIERVITSFSNYAIVEKFIPPPGASK